MSLPINEPRKFQVIQRLKESAAKRNALAKYHVNPFVVGDGQGQVLMGVCPLCKRKNVMVLGGTCSDCEEKGTK